MDFASHLRRYGLAVISCGLALGIARPLDAPSSCFFLAVMVSSLYGGRGPGLLSIVLSAAAFVGFFVPALFHPFDPSSSLRLAVFLGATILISVLIQVKRRAEESRRGIDAQYRTIADTAPDGIVSIDGGLRILFVNRAVTKIFGWESSELLGQPLTVLLPEFQFT